MKLLQLTVGQYGSDVHVGQVLSPNTSVKSLELARDSYNSHSGHKGWGHVR